MLSIKITSYRIAMKDKVTLVCFENVIKFHQAEFSFKAMLSWTVFN